MVQGVQFRTETGSSKQDILFHLDLLPMGGRHTQGSLSWGHWSIGEALAVCTSPFVIVSLSFFFFWPLFFSPSLTFINGQVGLLGICCPLVTGRDCRSLSSCLWVHDAGFQKGSLHGGKELLPSSCQSSLCTV